MNLEPVNGNNKPAVNVDDLFDDLDFKPITSGLGFHHKGNNPKPAFTDRVTPQAATSTPTPVNTAQALKQSTNGEVYQNDLSAFYNNSAVAQLKTSLSEQQTTPIEMIEKKFKTATSINRFWAYLADLVFISSLLSVVVIVMARMIHMDVVSAWSNYPQEITPLVISLFVGFYMMYFSIFDKYPGASIGKSLFNLKVVKKGDQKPLTFSELFLRSFVTLAGFLSFGLFSYFDLQNKMTSSEVVKVK